MKIFSLLVIAVWAASIYGWVANLVKLVPLVMVDGPLMVTGMLVGRILGVFVAPLGAVLGFF